MGEAFKIMAESGGIYGIVIFGLCAALVMLWRHLNKMQEKYDKLQEARVAEAKEVVKELMEYSKTMDGLSVAVTALKDVIMSQRARV